MKLNNVDKQIKKILAEMLLINEDRARSAFGRVRSNLFNSRDKSNVRERSYVDRSSSAREFMKSLGLTKAVDGESDSKKIYNLLRKILRNQESMNEAYGALALDGNSISISSDLPKGWAAKFLQLSIIGGINSGLLDIKSNDILISSSGKKILITIE